MHALPQVPLTIKLQLDAATALKHDAEARCHKEFPMPLEPTAHIWHNGDLIPWEKAQIHVMSHVVHYGSSVFEGIRCYKQQGDAAAIFRLPEHMQRLAELRQDLPHGNPLHAGAV